MLNSFFQKRKKLDARSTTLKDLRRFRARYEAAARLRGTRMPLSLEKNIQKAVSGVKDLSSLDFQHEVLQDDQVFALAETLLDFPVCSRLIFRENAVSEDAALAILELLRLQILQAKDSKFAQKMIESGHFSTQHIKLIFHVALSGSKISDMISHDLQLLTCILRREDKRLEIRAIIQQSMPAFQDSNSSVGSAYSENLNHLVEGDTMKTILKFLTGKEPSKKDLSTLMTQVDAATSLGSPRALKIEDMLCAMCAGPQKSSDSAPPWEMLVQRSYAPLKTETCGAVNGMDIYSKEDQRNSFQGLEKRTSTAEDDRSNPSECFGTAVLEQETLVELSTSSMFEANSNDTNMILAAQHEEAPMYSLMQKHDDTQTCMPPSIFELLGEEAHAEKALVQAHVGDMNAKHTLHEKVRASVHPVDEENEELRCAEYDDGPCIFEVSSMATRSGEENDAGPISVACTLKYTRRVEKESVQFDAPDTSIVLLDEYSSQQADEYCNEDDILQSRDLSSERLAICVSNVRCQGKCRHVLKIELRESSQSVTALDASIFPTSVPMDTLLVLILSNMYLEDLDAMSTFSFPHLRVLDISSNLLSNVGKLDFVKFQKLRVLDLSKNQLTSVPGLNACPKLEAINMSHNRIKSVQNVELCHGLQQLNMSNNQIGTLQAVRLLSLNTKLLHLDLDGNPIFRNSSMNDETAKRVAISIRNYVPSLMSLGSAYCASLKSTLSAMKGKNAHLPDKSTSPMQYVSTEFECLWITSACELIGIRTDSKDHCKVKLVERKNMVSRKLQESRDLHRSRYTATKKTTQSPSHTNDTARSMGRVRQINSVELSQRTKELSAPKYAPLVLGELKAMFYSNSRRTFATSNLTVSEKLELRKFLSTNTNNVKSARSNHRSKRSNNVFQRGVAKTTQQPNAFSKGSSEKVEISETNILPSKQSKINKSYDVASMSETMARDTVRECESTGPDRSCVVGNTDMFLQVLSVQVFRTYVKEELFTAETALSVLINLAEDHNAIEKLEHYRAKINQLRILEDEDEEVIAKQSLLLQQSHQFDPHLQDQFRISLEQHANLMIVKQRIQELLRILQSHPSGSDRVNSFCKALKARMEADDPNDASGAHTDDKLDDFPPTAIAAECELVGVASGPASKSGHLQLIEKEDDYAQLLYEIDAKQFSFDTDDLLEDKQKRNRSDESGINNSGAVTSMQKIATDKESDSTSSGSAEDYYAQSVQQVDAEKELSSPSAASEHSGDEIETHGNWEKGFDAGTGHYFWYNHATGDSQWGPPSDWPTEKKISSTESSLHMDESNRALSCNEDIFDELDSLPGFD